MTPAGLTFTCDLNTLQVFFGMSGYGATHSVDFRDIVVSGYLKVMRLVRAPTGMIVAPAGAAGYLDRSEPAGGGGGVGELELSAVYEVGELITGCVRVTNDTGDPVLHTYFPLTFYKVTIGEPFDAREPLFARTLSAWGEPGLFCFEIETDDLEPGFYDLRLGFPDGTVGWFRVELVPAT
jgi:hypothetical protein